MSVQPGTHTFTFSYDKDGSVSYGSDAGWIDFMELPAVELPGVPDIEVDFTPIAGPWAPNATEDVPLNHQQRRRRHLDLRLESGGSRDPRGNRSSNPVPYSEFGKDEKDDRARVSPVAGFGGPDAFGYSWIDSDEAGRPGLQLDRYLGRRPGRRFGR